MSGMDDDDDTRCRGCGTNFVSYRTLRLHIVRSAACGRKRELVEDIDDENSDGDGAVDQLLPPEVIPNPLTQPHCTPTGISETVPLSTETTPSSSLG